MNDEVRSDETVQIVVDEQQDTRVFYASFSGPLPPPNMLASYEKALPGSAERMLKMLEEQARLRREIEREEVISEIKFESRSMWIAFVLTLILMISGSIMIILTEKSVEGFIALFGPSIFHAGSYMYKKYQEEKVEKTLPQDDEV